MGYTPELPDGTPHEVGGWTYDPEPYNGNAWFGDDDRASVFVHPSIGDGATVKVQDERVSWGGKQYLTSTTFVDDLHESQLHDVVPDDPAPEEPSYEAAVTTAVEWMQAHDPADWQHPRVSEMVFDPPSGCSLETYELSARKTDVTYRLDDPAGKPDVVELNLESFTRTHNLTVVRYGEHRRKPRREERDLEASTFEGALREVQTIGEALRGDESGAAAPGGQTVLESFSRSEVLNP